MGGRFVGRVDMDDKIKPNGGEKKSKRATIKTEKCKQIKSKTAQDLTNNMNAVDVFFFIYILLSWKY